MTSHHNSNEWTVLEKLLLTQAVYKYGENMWFQVARVIKQHDLVQIQGIERPPDFYSQKNCSYQYYVLVEHLRAETEAFEDDIKNDMPVVVRLARQLYTQRVDEIKDRLKREQEEFDQLATEIHSIKSGEWDHKLTAAAVDGSTTKPVDATADTVSAIPPSVTGADAPIAAEATHTADVTSTTSSAEPVDSTTSLDDSTTSLDDSTVANTANNTEMDADIATENKSASNQVEPKDEKENIDENSTEHTLLEKETIEENRLKRINSDLALQETHQVMKRSRLNEPSFADSPERVSFDQEDHVMSTAIAEPSPKESNEPPAKRIADAIVILDDVPATSENIQTDVALTDNSIANIYPSSHVHLESQSSIASEPSLPSEDRSKSDTHPAEAAVQLPTIIIPKETDDEEEETGSSTRPSTSSPSPISTKPSTLDDEDHTGSEANTPTPKRTSALSNSEQRQKAWQKNINLLWQEIANHKNGTMFMNPIKKSYAPMYDEVVKQPLYLKTIKNRVRDGIVRTTTEFERDVVLMLTNSLMYNKEGTEMYLMAKEMLEDVREQIRLFKSADSYSAAFWDSIEQQ